MKIADLTWNFTGERISPQIRKEEVFLQSGHTKYTGIIYTFTHESMCGTYIDLPGHIAETDDGFTAENFPVENLYRIPADVIHLNKQSGDGAVNGEDLERELPSSAVKGQTLILNALGTKNPADIENRSVYLSESAVDWIIRNKYKTLVSDIYESQALHGVFLKLFKAGICTVCMPANLYQLPQQVFLTVLFVKMPGVTQLPCRLVAEF